MCLHKIKIRNNSRSYQSRISPLYLEAPCGHCAECSQQIQNDWFVRLAYEWFYNQRINGICYFVTLTYNNDSLPFLNVTNRVYDVLSTSLSRLCKEDVDVDKRAYEFKVATGVDFLEYRPFSHNYFSRKDLSKMLKALRQIFDYKGIYHYDDKESIKFWIGSEYGHEEHRVHYHALFFLPFQISKSDFLDCLHYAWSFTVKRADCPDFILERLENRASLKNGITRLSTPNGKNWLDWFIKKSGNHIYVKHLRGKCEFSKKHPAQLQSVEGLKYVTKYVSKRDEYMNNPRWNVLQQYLRIFPRNLDSIKGRFPELCKYVEILRAYFPKVHSSNGLGISILDEFNLLNDDEKVRFLTEESISIAGQVRKFRVPAYIVNRVMYDKDNLDNTLRVLSPIGVKVLKFRLNLRLEEFEKNIKNMLASDFSLLNKEDIELLKEEFPYEFNGDLYKPSLKNLAIYKYFFQFVQCPTNSIFEDLDAVIDTFYAEYFHKKIYKEYDVETRPSCMPPMAVAQLQKFCWNLQPCFNGFDRWLEYYDSIRLLINKRKSEYYQKMENERVYYRKFYNSMIYCPY